MAKGKSQYCTWYCKECNRANYVTYYDKRRNEEIVKELNKFCPGCRKHVEHKRKDTKKGSGK
ncbi:MAG: 50S ribosomal protein L33 [Candidatus Gracilibacteria bacterium]